jgi:TATA-binding protein-associated factor
VDLVDETDFSGPKPTSKPMKQEQPQALSASASSGLSKAALPSPGLPNDVDLEGLSARERNKLKRRAKTDLKFKGKDK